MKTTYFYLIFLVASFVGSTSISGQPVEAPSHLEEINIDLGIHNGKNIDLLDANGVRIEPNVYTIAGTIAFPPDAYIVVQESIGAADHAPWIRLVFGEVELGENSYIIITSDFDQDQQYFNARTIEEWYYHSAFFKGESVTLQLYVAPGDEGVTIEIPQLIVGDFVGGQPIPLDVCGSDNRLTSTYQHIDGRLMPLGCTGWISAAGFYLTAGHCLDVSSASLQIMEFYVPASLCDGTTQPAAVNNQYPVIYSSRVFQNVTIGDDWGIFNVGANSNTGRTPAENQRAYYHLSKDLSPPSIFIRGFGTDNVPTGCTGGNNADSQTCQYHTSSSQGEFGSGSTVYWEYQTDTDGGNSGSAVLASGVSGVDFHSVGIHTNGYCVPPNEGNEGTSFEADDTESNMSTYWQTQVEYVDIDHHLSSTNGTSVQPHYSLQVALNQANAGHGPGVSALELIPIAGSNYGSGGVYPQVVSYSGATNAVVIRRTVGAVKIGPNALADSPIIATLENGD
ncbi:MAG: hypothetical protein JW731_08430 [Bacteroidales bacterium]|nr:hypothetical protein [Bacteroidales bacterium]